MIDLFVHFVQSFTQVPITLLNQSHCWPQITFRLIHFFFFSLLLLLGTTRGVYLQIDIKFTARLCKSNILQRRQKCLIVSFQDVQASRGVKKYSAPRPPHPTPVTCEGFRQFFFSWAVFTKDSFLIIKSYCKMQVQLID